MEYGWTLDNTPISEIHTQRRDVVCAVVRYLRPSSIQWLFYPEELSQINPFQYFMLNGEHKSINLVSTGWVVHLKRGSYHQHPEQTIHLAWEDVIVPWLGIKFLACPCPFCPDVFNKSWDAFLPNWFVLNLTRYKGQPLSAWRKKW